MLIEQVRDSFDNEQALERWLQEQMEQALLQLYNSQRRAVLSKARQTIEDMRQHSEENGNSELTLDEINEEIRQARLKRKKNTGNLRHFPKSPIVVTPAEMISILEAK